MPAQIRDVTIAFGFVHAGLASYLRFFFGVAVLLAARPTLPLPDRALAAKVAAVLEKY